MYDELFRRISQYFIPLNCFLVWHIATQCVVFESTVLVAIIVKKVMGTLEICTRFLTLLLSRCCKQNNFFTYLCLVEWQMKLVTSEQLLAAQGSGAKVIDVRPTSAWEEVIVNKGMSLQQDGAC